MRSFSDRPRTISNPPDGFRELGGSVADILNAVGVSYCAGGVMAKNAEWCLPATRWRDTIEGWLRGAKPEHILNADIFFDGLPVHGALELGDRGPAGGAGARATIDRVPPLDVDERRGFSGSRRHVRAVAADGRPCGSEGRRHSYRGRDVGCPTPPAQIRTGPLRHPSPPSGRIDGKALIRPRVSDFQLGPVGRR